MKRSKLRNLIYDKKKIANFTHINMEIIFIRFKRFSRIYCDFVQISNEKFIHIKPQI